MAEVSPPAGVSHLATGSDIAGGLLGDKHVVGKSRCPLGLRLFLLA